MENGQCKAGIILKVIYESVSVNWKLDIPGEYDNAGKQNTS